MPQSAAVATSVTARYQSMKQLFINLPVKDLAAASHFYRELGFAANPLFTFEDQVCMVYSDQIYLMLQTYNMSARKDGKRLADPRHNRIATFTLPVESARQVDAMMAKGLAAGGAELSEVRDAPFLYIRYIEDTDGHSWGIMCLDMEKFKGATGR